MNPAVLPKSGCDTTLPSTPGEVYFLHIPKTAGTALRRYLTRFYPRSERLPYATLDELALASRESLQSYRFYCGHFGTGLYSLIDRPLPTVTMLRHPFDQTVSGMRYRLRHGSTLKKLEIEIGLTLARTVGFSAAKQGPLRDWALLRFNQQTIALGVDLDLNPFLGKPCETAMLKRRLLAIREFGMDAILERAKRRLDTMVEFGVVERFDEGVGRICDRIGVPRPVEAPVANVAPGNTPGATYRASGDLPAKLCDLIEANNQFDKALYQYALETLDHRVGLVSAVPSSQAA